VKIEIPTKYRLEELNIVDWIINREVHIFWTIWSTGILVTFSKLCLFIANQVGMTIGTQRRVCCTMSKTKINKDFEYQFRDASLRLYKDLCNLQTKCSPLRRNPGGNCIKTSLCKSPCKKELFTSDWWRGQFFAAMIESKTLTVTSLTTGANVSK